LALRNSKSKLDSLDDLTERMEDLEESQNAMLAQIEKLNSSTSFSLWTIASVGIPVSVIAWYSFGAYQNWKRGKLQ